MRAKLTPTSLALVLAALAATPAAALEITPAGESVGSFVRGRANALQGDPGDDWRGVRLAPSSRELRLSPGAAVEGGLFPVTPSYTFRGSVFGFGGESGTAATTAGDVETMRLGGGVGFGALRFGGALESNSEAASDLGARQRGFDLGASYDAGNFTTGFTWSRGIYRDFAASGAPSSSDELSLSLSYRLGRGIDLIGALQYGESEKASSPETGSSGSFIFGTAIRF